jgi:hypothetical protein
MRWVQNITFTYHYYNFFQLKHCSLQGLLCDLSMTFQFSPPGVSPRESTQRRKVGLWARNVREFCLNVDLHFTFRDLLHVVKLQHGSDGFTSPPKEGVLRSGVNPRTWAPKASTLPTDHRSRFHIPYKNLNFSAECIVHN